MEEDKKEVTEEIKEVEVVNTKAVNEEKLELENVETEKVEQGATNTIEQRKGLSIASMVLGICSIVFLSPVWISIPCGILAIIFGIKGQKRDGKKMAKAGFIMGIIGLSLVTLLFIAGLILGAVLVGSIASMI